MKLEDIKKKYPNLLAAFCYGSTVYGYKKASDHDYILVTKDGNNHQFSQDNSDYTVYSEEGFLHQIRNHEISCLECLYLPKEFVLYDDLDIEIDIDKTRFRKAISAKTILEPISFFI